MCAADHLDCGTTANGVLLLGSFLYAFNVGDSHAVICRGGAAESLLPQHKPETASEARRIEAANGWLTSESDGHTNILRVCGDLSVSRAIGDPDYKLRDGLTSSSPYITWPVGHTRSFRADVITAQPDVRQLRITRDLEFIIIASDGLWDVVTPSEAVARAREILASGESPSSAAHSLAALAGHRGSDDDTTVLVVALQH